MYLPMAHGFMYFAAILDVASRKLRALRLANIPTADFCVEAPCCALAKLDEPRIFNANQREQFTSDESTPVLQDAGVAIRMNSRGR